MQSPIIKRTIQTEYGLLSYNLIYKNVKNYNLRVKANQNVDLSVNFVVPQSEADLFVLEKSQYIFKHLNRLKKAVNFEPRKYLSGENINYLGKQFRLKIIETDIQKIYIDGTYLNLCVKEKNDFYNKKKIYDKWLETSIIEIFAILNAKVAKRFERYNIQPATIQKRKMRSRWGSCNPSKKIITLNSILIEVNRDLIEYVLTHEYVHFIYPNHSKEFYSLLSIMLPNWKDLKSELEIIGSPLLANYMGT